MRLVKKMNVTVLASFHDLNLAAAYCSRLLVLDQGEIVADGAPESVLSESLLKKTFKADCFPSPEKQIAIRVTLRETNLMKETE